jgi:hypothetical protein
MKFSWWILEQTDSGDLFELDLMEVERTVRKSRKGSFVAMEHRR